MLQPLMPQGVEHVTVITDVVRENNMLQPLMPQGVEHLATVTELPNSLHVTTSDAARR